MAEVPTVKLNSGARMPAIGFGTWQVHGDTATEAVKTALEAGYRLIDTAKVYGNEVEVGEAVRSSGVPRNHIFVTTKLWTRDFGYESALEAFDESNERLNLGYIDLYLIHWPGTELRHDSWRAMVEIYERGDAKAIGVSNYEVKHLQELLERSGLEPAVNQIEFHPFIYHKQAPILAFCKKHNIIVEAYSPLAMGRHMKDRLISAIAKKTSKTNAQIMLRWAIQHGTVPIPKSAHQQRIKGNLDVFDFELSKQEMQALDGLGSGKGESALPFWVKLIK